MREAGWRLSPVGYVTLVVTPKKLAQPREVIYGLNRPSFCSERMCIEEFMVVLIWLLFSVERSNAIRSALYGVRVPLLRIPEEECVAKEFSFCCVAGRAVTLYFGRGRTTREKSSQQFRDFDATMDFPGEDISYIRC